jgi:aspartate ammonia-lyase
MPDRVEKDLLGEKYVPKESLYGIHTGRAIENFPLSGRRVHPELIKAYGTVKLACLKTIHALFPDTYGREKQDAVEQACTEVSEGRLNDSFPVDALQGGSGTSLNMNLNEVIANRALALLKRQPGEYEIISPSEDINRFQSTNDTYPTALKLAAVRLLNKLEEAIVRLQEAFQRKEQELSRVVKIGRTELQDAVLTTLGREMSAYAEALSRDRWRIYKCEERLRVVNLGGTAIGTGLAAPRQYIFLAVETLRELTGIGFSRAENLVEATQNADVFVEVSGMLKSCAANLIKISNDLRLLSSGPDGGLGEINLPERQAGSSIMPGKVNPVIPEAVVQAGILVIGYDGALTQACYGGSLELNPFLPLVAECLLNETGLLRNAASILAEHCVEGLTANPKRCLDLIYGSSTALATALLPALGYEGVQGALLKAKKTGRTLREIVIGDKMVTEKQFEALISPEAVLRLGTPDEYFMEKDGKGIDL